MEKIRRSFLTRDAADAFVDGLAYAGSQVDNVELRAPKHRDFVVTFEHHDGDAYRLAGMLEREDSDV